MEEGLLIFLQVFIREEKYFIAATYHLLSSDYNIKNRF